MEWMSRNGLEITIQPAYYDKRWFAIFTGASGRQSSRGAEMQHCSGHGATPSAAVDALFETLGKYELCVKPSGYVNVRPPEEWTE